MSGTVWQRGVLAATPHSFCLSPYFLVVTKNEDQLQSERHKQVWFTLFVDKRLDMQIKLCNPSTTSATPKRFCIEAPSLIGALYDPLTFY